MALYEPDYTLIKAQEVVDNLKDGDKKETLILYYINDLKLEIKEKNETIKKYRKFFELLNDLLPRNLSVNDKIY